MNLRAPPVFNIRIQSVPFNDVSVAIMQGVGAYQKPTIFAVGPTKPRLRLAAFAGSYERAPNRCKAAEIVRMNRRRPTPIHQLLGGQPHVVEIVLIYEIHRTVGAGRPHQRWNRIDRQPEIALARRERLFSTAQRFSSNWDPASRIASVFLVTVSPARVESLSLLFWGRVYSEIRLPRSWSAIA
jgi:hypothetical protein